MLGSSWGSWSVLDEAERPSWSRYEKFYNCRCVCGAERRVRASYLKNGSSTSCGCSRTRQSLHGIRHPLYSTWQHMHARCRQPSHQDWKNYGARGIEVCARWTGRGGFQLFLADMGERPSTEHSIDRIDNDGCYSPDNCRWATRAQQNMNRRPMLILSAAETSFVSELLSAVDDPRAELLLKKLSP